MTLWEKILAGFTALATITVGYRIVTRPARTKPGDPLLPPIDNDGCSRAFFPSPNSSARPATGNPPTLVVVHDTEGGSSARNIAAFFYGEAAKVSSHLVVDEKGDCYRCVEDAMMAWHAGPANGRSLGIELVAPVGAYKRTREEWLNAGGGKLLDAAADHVADWCRKWGIPVEFVDGEGLKAGKHGITTHAAVTDGLGGSHVDPGKSFPMDVFLDKVRARRRVV